jgi:hypothetical protein
MKGKQRSTPSHLRLPLAACLFLLLASVVLAQSGGGYDLSRSTVDGGGSTFSSGGIYSLGGTAGQPDAGMMAGGVYTLGGGFWGGGAVTAPEYRICLPLVTRGY